MSDTETLTSELRSLLNRGDGKPRCAKHPSTCLIRANSLRSPFTLYAADAHVCARCLREEMGR